MNAMAREADTVDRMAVAGSAHPLVVLAFFVSGFPALIYQLTWQRALFTLYGTNV